MPLHILQRRRTADPGITCDHCGEAITTAADGNYQWRHTDEGETTTQIVFTHKRCCHYFELLHPGHWMAIDLAWLVVFLANNLKVDVKQTKAVIRRFNC
jgi:hypothetical protein